MAGLRPERYEHANPFLPALPPRCPTCGGPGAAGVVWFGEALPGVALEAAVSAPPALRPDVGGGDLGGRVGPGRPTPARRSRERRARRRNQSEETPFDAPRRRKHPRPGGGGSSGAFRIMNRRRERAACNERSATAMADWKSQKKPGGTAAYGLPRRGQTAGSHRPPLPLSKATPGRR